MTFEERTDLHGRVTRLFTEDDFLWCQDTNARNDEGIACHWQDGRACAFNLLAAIYKAYKGHRDWYDVIAPYLVKKFGSGFWEWPVLQWNDVEGRSYDEVLALLDEYKL